MGPGPVGARRPLLRLPGRGRHRPAGRPLRAGGGRLARRPAGAPGRGDARPATPRSRRRHRHGRRRLPAPHPEAGRRRRPWINPVVRHCDRRRAAVRQDPRSRRAQLGPHVPGHQVVHPQGRRRRAAVQLAATGRGARGVHCPQGPRRRRPHTEAAQRRHRRRRRDAAGLRGHRREVARRPTGRGDHRRGARPHLGPGDAAARPAHRAPGPSPGQRVPGRRRPGLDDRLRLQRARRHRRPPGPGRGRAHRLLGHQGGGGAGSRRGDPGHRGTGGR